MKFLPSPGSKRGAVTINLTAFLPTWDSLVSLTVIYLLKFTFPIAYKVDQMNLKLIILCHLHVKEKS